MEQTIKMKLIERLKTETRNRFDEMTTNEYKSIRKDLESLPDIKSTGDENKDGDIIQRHMSLLGIDINRLYMYECYNHIGQQQLNETK